MDKNAKKTFVIIPDSWKVGRRNATEILAELRRMTREAFYSMAAHVGIDLDLLNVSGYDFVGLSMVAVTELEGRLPKKKFDEVCQLISSSDYDRSNDFRYVYSLYTNDGHKPVGELHPSEQSLIGLFIDEFRDDKTEARKKVFRKYKGLFIDMPELDSFLNARSFICWYKGDVAPVEGNDAFVEEVEEAKIIKELIYLFKVLVTGDEMQIQSARIKSNKVTLSPKASKRLADILATAFEMYYAAKRLPLDEDDAYNPLRFFTWHYIKDARKGGEDEELFDLKKIQNFVDGTIDNFSDELDLDLFYYLADNAIKWPAGKKITDRCLFLFRLAVFFKFVPQMDYDATMAISTRKEIADAIKFKIKRIREKDVDGEILRNILNFGECADL